MRSPMELWQSRQGRLIIVGLVYFILGLLFVLLSSYLSDFFKSSINGLIFQGLFPALGYATMVGGVIFIVASFLRAYPFQAATTGLTAPAATTGPTAPAATTGQRAKAWDSAEEKLDNYFKTNLSQIIFIFWLSVAVMVVGFGFIIFGLTQVITATQGATKASNNIPGGSLTPAVIAGIAGTITEFIGATFLFIYRSTIQQASNHLEMLERINRVGMAMDIVESMTVSSDPAGLQDKTKAEVAKLLFSASSSPSRAFPEPGKPSSLRKVGVPRGRRSSNNSSG